MTNTRKCTEGASSFSHKGPWPSLVPKKGFPLPVAIV